MTWIDLAPVRVTSKDVLDSIYRGYIAGIRRQSLDSELRFCRQKAVAGNLGQPDFAWLCNVLLTTRSLASVGKGYLMPRGLGALEAYGRVKSYAMRIAQILFVDRLVKHGFHEAVDAGSFASTINEIADKIKDRAIHNRGPIEDDEARFFAVLFVFQLVFDRKFVPDHDIVSCHRGGSGRHRVISDWARAIAYLKYTNTAVVDAPGELRNLCYEITTGWSRGIDIETWNKLNDSYYSGKSMATGKKNVFAAHYDVILERMLPQFAMSKILLAERIIKDLKRLCRPVRVVDIGAGSGAMAINLLMAAHEAGLPAGRIQYLGLEPCRSMINKFKSNFKSKAHCPPPAGWEVRPGSLERAIDALPPSDGRPTWACFSYCLHHCFHKSVELFFTSPEVQSSFSRIYALDVVAEHGWLKPFYTWVDCESPENFDNVAIHGPWRVVDVWNHPSDPIAATAVTNAWCSCRILEP
ncbi:MAG: class I SAM-dependent methyltransferase [Deltaproteobacteria bacterium]|nr:class I SAM-dependent methyltransferase [Deltaproteobacteria bacterium]